MDDISSKVINASKWSALTEITTKAITPLVFVILARLLTPEDYGVVAAASIVIGFSQIFSDAGLSSTLIQTRENVSKVATIVFWVNLLFTSLIFLIIFFASGWIATLFKDERIADVLKVQSLILILNGLSTTHSALFKKALDFKKLFWVKILTVGAPGLASIPLAYFGYGYWALVVGSLVGALIQVILLWKIHKWRPAFTIDKVLVKKILVFSKWVTLEGLLGWFYHWGDSTIIAIYLSTQELGLYRNGYSFIVMVFGFFLSPLTPVIYSYFSNINETKERIATNLLRVNKILASISLFIGFILCSSSGLMEHLFFGANWTGIYLVISFLALREGFSWYFGGNFEAYRAVGKPHVNVILMLIGLAYYIPVYFIFIPMGLQTFLVAKLALVFIGHFIHIFAVSKIFKISYNRWFKNFANIFIFIISGGILFFIMNSFYHVLWAQIAFLSVFSIIYFRYIFKSNHDIQRIFAEKIKPFYYSLRLKRS